MHCSPVPAPLSMTQVLLCGAAVVTLSMGIRHGFGVWLQPTTMDRGWSRETFAFAIARRVRGARQHAGQGVGDRARRAGGSLRRQ